MPLPKRRTRGLEGAARRQTFSAGSQTGLAGNMITKVSTEQEDQTEHLAAGQRLAGERSAVEHLPAEQRRAIEPRPNAPPARRLFGVPPWERADPATENHLAPGLADRLVERRRHRLLRGALGQGRQALEGLHDDDRRQAAATARAGVDRADAPRQSRHLFERLGLGHGSVHRDPQGPRRRRVAEGQFHRRATRQAGRSAGRDRSAALLRDAEAGRGQPDPRSGRRSRWLSSIWTATTP